MFDMRKFLIVFVAAGLAKNLPLYGAYPTVKDLLMHLTGTVKDEKPGELICEEALERIFTDAFCKAVKESKPAFKGLGEDKNAPEEGVCDVLKSENFAKYLLTDEFVNEFKKPPSSSFKITAFFTKKDREDCCWYDVYYKNYRGEPSSIVMSMNFKFKFDMRSSAIVKGSVCVGGIWIKYDADSIVQSPDRWFDCCNLFECLKEIYKKEEESGFKEKSKETLKRKAFCVESSSELGESLEVTFSKYPTPDTLLTKVDCSDANWDNAVRYVLTCFREWEESKDEQSPYAKSKILFKLQDNEVQINQKGIPCVEEKVIPFDDMRTLNFKQICEVLLSVDFAQQIFGTPFIASFLRESESSKSSISVNFEESVDGENIFDFRIKYLQETKGFCRVHIEFSVCYDADNGVFKQDGKGQKVRIINFSIGEFKILPLNKKEVLRSGDLKYLGTCFRERTETIERCLFSHKGRLFVRLVEDELLKVYGLEKSRWESIRNSVADVAPYEGVCITDKDHDPKRHSNVLCDCHDRLEIFRFMYDHHWISVKDWFTGGAVVLLKRGYVHKYMYKCEKSSAHNCKDIVLGGFSLVGGELLEEKELIGREWLINGDAKVGNRPFLEQPPKEEVEKFKNQKDRKLEDPKFQEGDWPLFPSSVFMVGVVQSNEKSKEGCQKDVKKDCPKERILKKISGNNTILEAKSEEEEEEDEEEEDEEWEEEEQESVWVHADEISEKTQRETPKQEQKLEECEAKKPKTNNQHKGKSKENEEKETKVPQKLSSNEETIKNNLLRINKEVESIKFQFMKKRVFSLKDTGSLIGNIRDLEEKLKALSMNIEKVNSDKKKEIFKNVFGRIQKNIENLLADIGQYCKKCRK